MYELKLDNLSCVYGGTGLKSGLQKARLFLYEHRVDIALCGLFLIGGVLVLYCFNRPFREAYKVGAIVSSSSSSSTKSLSKGRKAKYE